MTAVDLSAEALERVAANAALNGLANVTTRNANVFDLLRALDDAGERLDTVILDPPAFAKSRDAVEKAVRGYKEINLRALKILRAGGCLVTLLLLVSRPRGRLRGDPGRCRRRRRRDRDGRREAPPGARPPDRPGRARDLAT